MGDRANIVVMHELGEQQHPIYLYTHWRGWHAPLILQTALRKQARWTDAPYLTRIIFQTMLAGDDTEAGFGISSYLTDNQYSLLVVYPETKTVSLFPYMSSVLPDFPEHMAIRSWSFSDFIKIENISWAALHPELYK